MEDKVRGTIEQIAIDVSYPDGEKKQRIIRGDELKRLALIAFTPEAIRDYLGPLRDHEHLMHEFEHGFPQEDRGKPSMLAVYEDGTYSVECDSKSHNPPKNQ